MRIVFHADVLLPDGTSLWHSSQGVEVVPGDDREGTALACIVKARQVSGKVMDELEEQAQASMPGLSAMDREQGDA